MEVYNVAHESWEKRQPDQSPSVPLLGLAGRLGSVTRASKNAPAAFRLLMWLSSGDAQSGAQVSPASDATTLFRRAHVRSPALWSPQGTPASTAQGYARVVERTLSRTSWLPALRIPGGDEYLADTETLEEAFKIAKDMVKAQRLGINHIELQVEPEES